MLASPSPTIASATQQTASSAAQGFGIEIATGRGIAALRSKVFLRFVLCRDFS
jgi:hypothetical protein